MVTVKFSFHARMTAITLTLEPLIHLTPEQFYQLCRANPDAKLERTKTGELVVMSPTGEEGGSRKRRLIAVCKKVEYKRSQNRLS